MITLTTFSPTHYSETSISDIRGLSNISAEQDKTIWVDISGDKDENLLNDIRQTFGLHSMALNYIGNPTQSPRFEIYDSFQLLVSSYMYLENDWIHIRPISLIIGDRMIISIQNGQDMFEDIKSKLRSGEMRDRSIEHLVYGFLDRIISTYRPVMDTLVKRIDAIEGNIVSGKRLNNETGVEIHQISRKFLFIYQTIWSQNEALSDLIRNGIMATQYTHYLRHCFDYVKELMEMVDIYRDMSKNLMSVYLASVNNRLSSVMKILTICVSVLAPATIITGIFGMNFDGLPGLHEWWGVPMSLLLMGASSGGLLWLFKRMGLLNKS